MKMKKIESLIEAMHATMEFSSKGELIECIRLIDDVLEFSGAQASTLVALHDNGPLFDGDLPSKSGRDLLVGSGYAERVVVKGEQGYNACSQKGHYAKLVLDELRKQDTTTGGRQPADA
jgi:hypothetical protein